MKTCVTCGKPAPLEHFYKHARSAGGRRATCRACLRLAKQRYRARPEKRALLNAAARRRFAQEPLSLRRRRVHEYLIKYRARRLCTQAKARARRKGLAYDLDAHYEDIQARVRRGICELTGLPLETTTGQGLLWNAPSLDRRIPAKGYIHSNLRIICAGANSALGSWGEDVLLTIADGIRRTRKRKHT